MPDQSRDTRPRRQRRSEQLSPEHEVFWIPEETSKYTRLTVDHLAQLRFRGDGPAYFQPTPRTVLYRKSDVDAWLAASKRTGTSGLGVA